MPCDSSHLSASRLEVECSRMHMLIDEMKTGKHPNVKSSAWDGYDRRAYNSYEIREMADRLTAELCEMIQKDKDITKRSLELQVWARDHRIADERRSKKAAKVGSRRKRSIRE